MKKIRERLQNLNLSPTRISGCYYFRLCHENEVLRTLNKLPLRHPEKLAIKRLILSDKFTREQKLQLYRRYRTYIEHEAEKISNASRKRT